MSQPPCPPAGSPDESWDECVRSGSWTIGLGTIAGAIGTVVLGSETPIFVGTGLGMAWSLKRCRSLFREREAKECVYLQECQCPPTPCYTPSPLPEEESRQAECEAEEQETPPDLEEIPPPPCKEPPPPPPPKEETEERCFIPGSDQECCKIKDPEPIIIEETPKYDTEDECYCPPAEPIEETRPNGNGDVQNGNGVVQNGNDDDDDAHCSTMPPECNIPLTPEIAKMLEEDDRCTCNQSQMRPPPPITCTCPPPPSEICTCNNRYDMEPPRTETPQNCSNTNIFKWPPLLNFAQAKTQSKYTYVPEEELLCTCDDDDDEDDD